jgi:hypothetical protein
MKRVVQPELLDALPPDDPRAIRSRRDLSRINWWMHNHSIMASALKNNLPSAPAQITELGAGDGDFLLRVAQKMSSHWLDANVILFDRQKIVTPETIAAFAKMGWCAKAAVADVFDWSPSDNANEVVIANLFLHHFDEALLAGLLHNISQSARLFVAIEPCRLVFPSFVGPLLGFIGCNEVTRHDAVVSIRAGFAGKEISVVWPDQTNWQLTERRAGLFSHLFIAWRCE